MDLSSVGAGMGILVAISGAVWFVVKLKTEPVIERVKVLELAMGSLTATPLGQKVHDLNNTLVKHFEHDDARFIEIKALIADGRKENLDNFAELRTAMGSGRKTR
jgi:hypothetical protein